MSRSSKFCWLVLVLLLIIVIAIVFDGDRNELPKFNALHARIELPLKKTVENGSISTTGERAEIEGLSPNLSMEFSNAVNYRYLFERLKTHKDANGSFYILKIIEKCKKIKGQNGAFKRLNISADHKVAYARDRILTKHQILCDQFLENELSSENYSRFLLKENGDDLLKTISNLKRLDSRNNFHCNNLRNLFSSNSPEAIGTASLYSDARGDYFDGKFYAINDPILRNGMKLALCNLGQDCSSSNFEVENLCLSKGICERSLKDAYKQNLKLINKNSETEYRETILMAEKISNSIKSMSVSSFAPFNCT